MSTASHPVHVLLVEDSEDDAFFFTRALKLTDTPVNVVHVADGGEAIDYLQSVLGGAAPWPDVVFLDVKLPTRTGFEILEWLRAQPAPRRMTVAILSGSDQDADLQRAAALGVTAYFVKPIKVPQLELCLAEATRHRASAARLRPRPTPTEAV